MAATSAYAAASETAAALSRGRVGGIHPSPSRLAFLAKSPSRWTTISLSPGPRHATPAAAASEERVAEEEEGPAWVELEPICNEQQLDRALAEAQQLDHPIVLLWMASWCRKCIYLKPKLEKLAAEYYPRIRFYSVDVNAVPQKLVNRAGVTPGKLSCRLCATCIQFFVALSFSFGNRVPYQKMPSIQLWSDSQKQAEVIGGHKSWLVIDGVRRMIEQEE